MTDVHDEALSPIKRALLEIRELKSELARARGAEREPIAVVGMGLRFPGGARDADSFAQLLWSGTDAVTAIPSERWDLASVFAEDPDVPGKMTTRFGAFLERVDHFDAEFFGISPREAASMDPQQRLALEVAWHALEDAGHAPDELAGSRTGVYLGAANNDYGRAIYAHRDLIDAYFSSGNAYSVIAGRISYLLGLQGPSIAVDTACSSSLTAIHLACQGLRLRECDFALAGGVNLILTPEMNINFSKARMMAADGRCKTFDAAADGYVRGEGCGIIVLRRLSDALADHDRVLAVVRGSALNQDGRSGGLTAPNGPAQEDVIRSALAAADVSSRSIAYVEAHGTGTSLGDPIEAGALAAALCVDRDAMHPLLVGSVKTNVGHLEAAAGVAGVIKTVLALGRRAVPPNLHFRSGNPHIDWAAWPIKVPTSVTPLSPIDGVLRAGVSSFGFSGTNAHLILEEAPEPSPLAAPDRPRHILALSARDDAALTDLAAAYSSVLAKGVDAADTCFTANAGRSHFAERVAVVGASASGLKEGLDAFCAGRPTPAVATGSVSGAARPAVAFLFTGQGAQSPGMGRRLYDTSPVFRRALDQCAEGLAEELPRGLLDVIFDVSDESPIHETRYAQPATFAIEYALATLWQSWGIAPSVMVGHSLGEYAAACVAGVFSLKDGLRLVAARGRLTHELPADGAMAAVFAPEEVVDAEVRRATGPLSIAAYNGPEHCVISGARTSVQAALANLEQAGVRVKPLRVPHAAHSPLIEPILEPFGTVLRSVTFASPQIALVSNVTGTIAGADELCAARYWLDHMRKPVRFAHSMRTLQEHGVTHFIEVGPHPVLLGMGAECVTHDRLEWLPSLHRDREDWSDLLESLQKLYAHGADVDWSGFDSPSPRRRVALPGYPFRARRHWMDVVGQPAGREPSAGDRWKRVAAALERESERGPFGLDPASYRAKWDLLARLTTAHAAHVFHDCGVFAVAGEARTVDDVLHAGGIAPAYRHIVRRWLERLAHDGTLQRDGERYLATVPLAAPDLTPLWSEAEDALADNLPLLEYVRHCGDLLGPVLTGEVSPLETLFPGGSFELAEGLYERSTTMRYANGLAAAACEALSSTIPPGRTLRVLEVGAGTGGTTSSLLPALPADRTRYQCTDVSNAVLDRARTRFGNVDFVEFALFDVDRDPADQGYAGRQFDLIVSANAVHASRDLRTALERLHSLLAPGGMLMLVESTTHFDWFDMSTGLIEGWQHFADDLRGDNPLLSPSAWTEALTHAGFASADTWPREHSEASVLGQHVVLAQASGDSAGGIEAEPVVAQEPSGARRHADSMAGIVALRAELEAAPATDRLDMLRAFVRERVIRVLRLDEDDAPARNARLMDLGFDSLMAVQLRGLISSGLQLDPPLPATLMFDYPTIDAIAAHVLERLAPTTPAETVARQDAVPAGATRKAEVAAMSDADVEALLLDRLGKP
ncbi:MAG: type I polyketide synthase [Gemmatimonadales bacterium]